MRGLKLIYDRIYASFNNHEHKKRWQGGIGIGVMSLFVLSSLLFVETVEALNQVAQNYGYYGGTYGYNATDESSDDLPNAPTSISIPSATIGTASAVVSWTSPTLTVLGTSYDNAHATTPYLINYGTSSISSCTLSTASTSTSASVTLSSLSSGTTYNVAVCAYDANKNQSAALTGSFTTLSEGGSGGVSGGAALSSVQSVANIVTTTTTATTGPVVTTAVPAVITQVSTAVAVVKDAATLTAALNVKRDTAAEATYGNKVTQGASEFKVTLTAEVKAVATNFATYGTSNVAVQKLGAGERLAVIRDLLVTLGDTVAKDPARLLLAAEQISSGQKPTVRNLAKEQANVAEALGWFHKIMNSKRNPNFKDPNEDLVWNTLLYRIRFSRDLAKERVGINKFRGITPNKVDKIPHTPMEWSVVRAWGYIMDPALKAKAAALKLKVK